jgi:phage replication-related protein YjqB (UPF0714/DUF867 family)
MDRYANFTHLFADQAEGVDFRRHISNRNSQVAVIAPHGGAIEPGTLEIAEAVAANSFSYYAFEGCRRRANADLHVTSTNFDEPMGVGLVESAQSVIAIHGEGSHSATVFIGGRDQARAEIIEKNLREAGFSTARHENPELQGIAPQNICNRGITGAGVQLEISRGLRQQLFESLSLQGRKKPTEMLQVLATAIRSAL